MVSPRTAEAAASDSNVATERDRNEVLRFKVIFKMISQGKAFSMPRGEDRQRYDFAGVMDHFERLGTVKMSWKCLPTTKRIESQPPRMRLKSEHASLE